MSGIVPLPLEGVVVLDLSRMLPGAVLARQLLDLGARLIKVEDPDGGDPMRQVPPQVDGIGVGFAAFLRGAESVTLDLRDAGDADRARQLAARADVLVESFRRALELKGLAFETLDIAPMDRAPVAASNPDVMSASWSRGTRPPTRSRTPAIALKLRSWATRSRTSGELPNDDSEHHTSPGLSG